MRGVADGQRLAQIDRQRADPVERRFSGRRGLRGRLSRRAGRPAHRQQGGQPARPQHDAARHVGTLQLGSASEFVFLNPFHGLHPSTF